MDTTKWVLTALMSALMLLAGINHFRKPGFYKPIIPRVFLAYKKPVILLSGIVEILAGLGLFFVTTRYYAAILVLVLMLAFLPLHIWDLGRERPAMGSKRNAFIRLILQFVLIAWAWYIL